MPGTEDRHSRAIQTLAPYRWRGSRILEAVCEVNEHLVSALTELARHENASVPIVRQNADVLRRLDPAACRRAASIPVLLVDLCFQDEQWWKHTVRAIGVSESSATSFNFPSKYASEIAREALIVAWLAVQNSRVGANLLFGMSEQVADIFSELTPCQLGRAVERSTHAIRIRWQSRPDFWRMLIEAGNTGTAEELCEVQLLGLQLLGGDLMGERRAAL
jgi:hypothetical protein